MNVFSRIAADLMAAAAESSGRSRLPKWLVQPMTLIAAGDKEGDNTEIYRALAREAMQRLRAGKLVPDWLVSVTGEEAVQVLPQVQGPDQRRVLKDLGNYLQLITLNHPGLAPILKTAYEEGFPYLVARLGQNVQTLAERAKQPLEPRRAMRIATQVAEALEYAHYRGVIHGALDVDSVYVNDRGVITVLGVGMDDLYRQLGISRSGAARSSLTPPEVARGQTPDKRSDVYAVGALLYLLLTGKVPPPGRPVHLARSNPEVPPAVDEVLSRALATNPSDRYADLVELNRELRTAVRSPTDRPRQERDQEQPSTTQPLGPRVKTQELPAQDRVQRESETILEKEHAAPIGDTMIPGFPAALNMPTPLAMPAVDLSSLQQTLAMPEVPPIEEVAIPAPLEMPRVDWDELLRPLDTTHLAQVNVDMLTIFQETAEIPDPLQAAAQAARAKEKELEQAEAKPLPEATATGNRPARAQPGSGTNPRASGTSSSTKSSDSRDVQARLRRLRRP